MTRPPYRVVQWATGSIGQIAIRHFADNPTYELAGVYVTSAAKAGKDAGDLAGIPATGVRATDDIDAILALGADCVHDAPLHPNLDDVCRILRAGTNVVTPVGFVYPTPASAPDFAALRAACADGGSSIHDTGVHPGFSGDLLPLVFSRVMTRVEQIQVREVADFRLHPSKAMQEALGFGRDPDDAVANPSPLVTTMDRIFEQSMTMVVEALDETVGRFTTDFPRRRRRLLGPRLDRDERREHHPHHLRRTPQRPHPPRPVAHHPRGLFRRRSATFGEPLGV